VDGDGQKNGITRDKKLEKVLNKGRIRTAAKACFLAETSRQDNKSNRREWVKIGRLDGTLRSNLVIENEEGRQ